MLGRREVADIVNGRLCIYFGIDVLVMPAIRQWVVNNFPENGPKSFIARHESKPLLAITHEF